MSRFVLTGVSSRGNNPLAFRRFRHFRPPRDACPELQHQGRSRLRSSASQSPRIPPAPRPRLEFSPRSLVFATTLVPIVTPIRADAQDAEELKRQAEAAGVKSEAEAVRKAKEAGLTRDQIRQALREAGYSDAKAEEIIGGGAASPASGGSGPSYTAPSVLDSAAVAPQMVPPPRGTMKPEDYPEFTKEIARRVPGAPAILPFGYEIFGYVSSTFEPLVAGPVDPDYPIGPGDEVIISVWGDNEFTHAADRDPRGHDQRARHWPGRAERAHVGSGQAPDHGPARHGLLGDSGAPAHDVRRRHPGQAPHHPGLHPGRRGSSRRLHDLLGEHGAQRPVQRGRSHGPRLDARHPDHPAQPDLEGRRPLRIHPHRQQGRGRPPPERGRGLCAACGEGGRGPGPDPPERHLRAGARAKDSGIS